MPTSTRLQSRFRSRPASLALLAAAAFALAACTSNAGAGTTPPSAVATSTPAPPTPAATPAATNGSGGGYGYGGYNYGPASSTPAAATATPAGGTLAVSSTSLGNVLTGVGGMTLYTFKKDSPGTSACTGSCASLWPPLVVSAIPPPPAGVTGTLGTITRGDGSTQLTYNGHPLYYYSGDKKAGDTNGQGIGNVWYVATP